MLPPAFSAQTLFQSLHSRNFKCSAKNRGAFDFHNMMMPGSKGQKAVHACMIRLLNLGPAKHEKVAIYAINLRISNVCRIAKVVKQRSNPYHCLQFSKEEYYDTNFQKKQENHKTIFVTVFFMLHCFSSYFLHKIGQAHNKEIANGSKNNCGQTNVHFLLCDFSF